MCESDWKNYVMGLFKAEIAKRNLNYVDIAGRLRTIGVDETPQKLSNEIGRGAFGAYL